MSSCRQSHYIEVAQGDIFMKHKMRFGQVLGRLAILKKKGADYEQLLRVFLSYLLSGAKNNLNFLNEGEKKINYKTIVTCPRN